VRARITYTSRHTTYVVFIIARALGVNALARIVDDAIIVSFALDARACVPTRWDIPRASTPDA